MSNATGQKRVFLFLQGPHGPFFHRLGAMLRRAGAAPVGFHREMRQWCVRAGPRCRSLQGGRANPLRRFRKILCRHGVTDECHAPRRSLGQLRIQPVARIALRHLRRKIG